MTIDDKDKPLLEKLLSNPEIANAIDELNLQDLVSKMRVFNNTLNIDLSRMMKLYEETLQLIVDDVGGQYFIDNIKSRSIYDFKEDVSKDNKILTLSTCTDDGTKRIVIHAKMIKAEYR